MNIAIIGAGVAGLSCAHELEKHGIYPTIYEKKSFIGEQHPNVGAILEIYHRPIKDAVAYFRNNLNIDIKPLNTLNRLIHFSPNKTSEIKGNLGYFFERSKEEMDIIRQLFTQLKNTRVLFNEYADYVTLSQEYDYVVIANGGVDFTDELGCWKQWMNTYIRGAIVHGDFDPGAFMVWLDKDYCKNGYVYLAPFSSTRAAVAVVVTDIDEAELEVYWEKFLDTENIKWTIEEEFKRNHTSGHVYPHRIGNLYLAGNAAGALDPLFGFGIMNSIATGVFAARSIVKGEDYEKMIRKIVNRNLRLYEYRKALNMVDNTGYDVLVASAGIPGIKHLVYYSPINVVKYGSSILRALPKRRTKETK